MCLLASGITCLGHLSLPPYMSVIVWLWPEISCEELNGTRGPLLRFREVQWPVVKSPFAKSHVPADICSEGAEHSLNSLHKKLTPHARFFPLAIPFYPILPSAGCLRTHSHLFHTPQSS